jgi:3-hydroxypropanoate dehydrogenase
MAGAIAKDCLNQIFLEARTHNKWLDKPVPDDLLRELVDIMKMGPTSANQSPARMVFVKSAEGKARLSPHLSEGNRAKTMSAPVCAIIGYDLRFYDYLPKLFPHADAKSWFEGGPMQKIETSAFRNGSLQGAYFIIAARALGLDTGPMSGFNNDGVDASFFAGTSVKSNFLCNLGYGHPAGVHPRSPRFSFDDIAKIV